VSFAKLTPNNLSNFAVPVSHLAWVVAQFYNCVMNYVTLVSLYLKHLIIENVWEMFFLVSLITLLEFQDEH
jgi:hypothetical protein